MMHHTYTDRNWFSWHEILANTGQIYLGQNKALLCLLQKYLGFLFFVFHLMIKIHTFQQA